MRTTHWLIYSQVTKLLCERGANLNARDSWGYTPLQRAATNDCVDAAKALLAAGASLEISSGLDGDGDNAYELAKRLRSSSSRSACAPTTASSPSMTTSRR